MIGAAITLAGCQEPDNSGSSRETKQTLVLSEQAAVTVGVPAIKNFTEKRQLKAIYELRDTANLVTYTYTIDMMGKRHKVCPTSSVGFGIPYATQYTAPTALRMVSAPYPDGTQSSTWYSHESAQPEPNGLHMPSAAEGTWVLCLNPATKEISPAYVEPSVVSYEFEMPSVD